MEEFSLGFNKNSTVSIGNAPCAVKSVTFSKILCDTSESTAGVKTVTVVTAGIAVVSPKNFSYTSTGIATVASVSQNVLSIEGGEVDFTFLK